MRRLGGTRGCDPTSGQEQVDQCESEHTPRTGGGDGTAIGFGQHTTQPTRDALGTGGIKITRGVGPSHRVCFGARESRLIRIGQKHAAGLRIGHEVFSERVARAEHGQRRRGMTLRRGATRRLATGHTAREVIHAINCRRSDPRWNGRCAGAPSIGGGRDGSIQHDHECDSKSNTPTRRAVPGWLSLKVLSRGSHSISVESGRSHRNTPD